MFWIFVICLFCVIVVIRVFLHLVSDQCKSKVCLVGKTALITGGNSGLGFAIAKELASRGCTIIIADKDDAAKSVTSLIQETRNPNISSKIVDFTSFKSVRLFAKEFKQNVEKLHILVNNAGIIYSTYEKTEDDLEKVMQVNYFSHFLLTHLLLDLLLKSAPSRIIYTSSIAAYVTSLSEKNLKGEPPGKWTSASYGNSKLAGAIMSKMLANKLDSAEVTSNVFHPGLVKTNILMNIETLEYPIMFLSFFVIAKIMAKIKTPEEGVQTLLHLACANEVERISGKFFMDCTSVWQPKQVHDVNLCKRIWELSEEYVSLEPEEKLDAILQNWRKKNY